MLGIDYFFWIAAIIVLYTYIGYGLLLYLLVKIKEKRHPVQPLYLQKPPPTATLLIAAYNEEDIVDLKMENCNRLNYPKGKLNIVWVTDGSTDNTNLKLAEYPEITVLHVPERKGKTAALNRGMQYIHTPFTVFTDANTMLNQEAIREILTPFSDPVVGCVAGEKRIVVEDKDNAAAGGEGFYWRYESKLKSWDSRLYSTVGAAGELFAIRTSLFKTMPEDTLLDDFVLSMSIASQGYKIAYRDAAYAIESASADIGNEQKRKVRIAAGGLQAIWRLLPLLNIFRHGILSFQYISHRVLRWSITPVLLFLLFPLNILLVSLRPEQTGYMILLVLQSLFYLMATGGSILQRRHIKVKILFIPYYFVFMNLNVIKAFFYLQKHKGTGAWEKAKRKQ
ncbi:glycosyltransferase family 2 protein [Sanguibacteroides justesenii]|uniref:Glycosyl transferase n=1 Tax=Sanguibacteroides justesenii TaxID=1547597 RepID=A0A0C3RHI7_9PORP|nr:glycosyltransferase family 2 protein [Sanguibacteroides justesenii]KIO46711.1 glycosyl transferase [Sanguibacteroides justesenii]KIO46902.1 glycosyl transferase [Sanguibacteroides justesenii]PXZ43528.1 glycosyltransferase family 2 protein [Sanguibacteroides justesenii]